MKSSLPAKIAYPPDTVYHDVAPNTERPPPGPRWRNIHRTDAQRKRSKKEQETPEEKEQRLARNREYQKQYRLRKKLGLPKKKATPVSERIQRSKLPKTPAQIMHNRAENAKRMAFFRELEKMKTADNQAHFGLNKLEKNSNFDNFESFPETLVLLYHLNSGHGKF
jgi:hypothetical protein